MKTGPGIRLALVSIATVLAGAAIASAIERAPAPPKPEPPPAASEGRADPARHLVRVYYFRTNTRCASCRKIEAFTDEAIKEAFAREIAGGKMIWQVVNIQEAGNGHFIQDYKLVAKSVVVVDVVDGGQIRWKNLPKIWELLNDQPGFVRYVQDEVRQYLEGRS